MNKNCEFEVLLEVIEEPESGGTKTFLEDVGFGKCSAIDSGEVGKNQRTEVEEE